MSDHGSPLPKALSTGPSFRFGRLIGCFGFLFGFVFCSMFFGIGSVLFYFMGLHPVLSVLDAKSWVETPCTIIEPNNGGRFGYEYEFGGQVYEGNQYSFLEMNGGPSINRLRKEAPIGSEAVCYVDPDDPFESVFHRGFTAEMWWGLFPIPFMIVGLIGYVVLFFVLRGFFRGESTASATLEEFSRGRMQRLATGPPQEQAVVRQVSNSDFDNEDLIDDSGPVTLELDSSPLSSFIGAAIIATIWNVIVGAFVAVRISDWMRGEWEWIPELILIPFGIIGIVLLGVAVHQFMATFNPTPTLTLSRRMIPLGQDATVDWTFDKNTSSIRALTITLKGVEEARYTRGTDTHTDTETFYEEVVSSTTDPVEISEGTAEISIPTNSMHSFSGGNNKVIWRLVVHGDVPMWPDVVGEFSVKVIPHE